MNNVVYNTASRVYNVSKILNLFNIACSNNNIMCVVSTVNLDTKLMVFEVKL